jgi:hypothetical protein
VSPPICGSSPELIWIANPSAVDIATAAGISKASAAHPIIFVSRVGLSSPKKRDENSRNPRISAPAMCTTRKSHVSIGSCGSSGNSIPVQRSIDRPFSAAMWKKE